MRTDYLYIYIMALLAILPTTLPAQNGNEKIRVYGKITDASTNETMPYTSVRIRNTSNGCSSDNNGNFSFFVNALRDICRRTYTTEQKNKNADKGETQTDRLQSEGSYDKT